MTSPSRPVLPILSLLFISSSPRPLRDAVVLSWVGPQSGFRPVVRHGVDVYVDVFLVARIVDVRVGLSRRGQHLNAATAISGTYHFAVMLAPTRRTLVWPSCPSGVGLILNHMEAVGLESAVGHMDEKGPCAPVVLML